MAKQWGGKWHMSKDGVVRRCYADEGNCVFGYHSDSERGSYEAYNNAPQNIVAKLPTPIKRAKLPTRPKLDVAREALIRGAGVTDNLNTSKFAKVSHHVHGTNLGNARLRESESAIYALNHKDFKQLKVERISLKETFVTVNGRKRPINENEMKIRDLNRKNFVQVRDRLNQRTGEILRIKNSSELSVMRQYGKTKGRILTMLEASNHRDTKEIAQLAKNHGPIESSTSYQLIATVSGDDERNSKTVTFMTRNSREIDMRNLSEDFVKDTLNSLSFRRYERS